MLSAEPVVPLKLAYADDAQNRLRVQHGAVIAIHVIAQSVEQRPTGNLRNAKIEPMN